MKKGLLLLSFVMLLFTTSCEDDSALSLAGTEWHQQPSLSGEVVYKTDVIIKFGETTYGVEQYILDGEERRLVSLGSGTYTCDEYSVILMVKGELFSNGVIANNQMVFGLDDMPNPIYPNTIYRFKKQ